MPSSSRRRNGKRSSGRASIAGPSQNKETSRASSPSPNDQYFAAAGDQVPRVIPDIDRGRYDPLPPIREAEVKLQHEELLHWNKVRDHMWNRMERADVRGRSDHKEAKPFTEFEQAGLPQFNSRHHAEEMNTGEQEGVKTKRATITPPTLNGSHITFTYNCFHNSGDPQTAQFSLKDKEKGSPSDHNVAEGAFQTKSERDLLNWCSYYTTDRTNTSRRQTQLLSNDSAQPLMTGAIENVYPEMQNFTAAKYHNQDQNQNGTTQPILDEAGPPSQTSADENKRHVANTNKAADQRKGKAREKSAGEPSKKKSPSKKNKTSKDCNHKSIPAKKSANEKHSKSLEPLGKKIMRWSTT